MSRGSRKRQRGGDPPALALFDPQGILATLKRHGVEFVVIGAYAAVTQGWSLPRLEALLRHGGTP